MLGVGRGGQTFEISCDVQRVTKHTKMIKIPSYMQIIAVPLPPPPPFLSESKNSNEEKSGDLY